MLNYLALLVTLVVAFYTVLFGIENFKEQNYLGFFAIIFLATVIVVLPFFILFLLD